MKTVQVKFPRQYLLDILWGETGENQIVEDTIVGKRRWTDEHRLVFKEEGKFYVVHYEEGSNESSEVTPFEWEGEEIVCTQVEPVEKTVIVYEPVKGK